MTAETELARVEAEIAATEEAIRKLDQILDVVFEHSQHGIAIGHRDGTLHPNRVAEEIFGKVKEAQGAEAWVEQYALYLEDGKTPFPEHELPIVKGLAGETIRGVTVRYSTPQLPTPGWLDVSARPLPDGTSLTVFREVTPEREAQHELIERNQALAEREAQNRELVDRLRGTLDALSTPVLEVSSGILAIPVIGVVDTQRGASMAEKILAEVNRTKARFVVIDLTGVAIIDTSTADRLLKLGSALRLLGAECVISGIQPAVAQTLVAIGVDISVMVPRRDLQHALEYARQTRVA